MSFFEAEETHQFSFEAFAAHPFYTTINRSLVQRALASLLGHPSGAPLTVVDMACGTGAATRLIAEELAHREVRARIIAVDPSADALRLAQQSIKEIGVAVDYFQGEADELPTLVREANAAFFCNAIHLIGEKRATFRQMAAILAPGGVFLPAIAPSIRAAVTRTLSALAVSGYATPCSGCAKSIQTSSGPARRRRSLCSGSLPRNTVTCSRRAAFAR